MDSRFTWKVPSTYFSASVASQSPSIASECSMDVVANRVRMLYPRCRSNDRALLISICASTRTHAPEIISYHLGSKISKELCRTLKLPMKTLSMTLDELSRLLGRSQQISMNSDVKHTLSTNTFVRFVIDEIESALCVTMQSDAVKSMWALDSVKAIVAFSTLLDMNTVIIEKLFGEISRSDARRLNDVNDDIQAKLAHSDEHLNALNALIRAFSASLTAH